jgi:predicted NUDIX family NTP pyrophosphohydrolase
LTRPPERSAGILLYRLGAGGMEVLLVHPGGPFWANKDEAAWSIPKGVFGPDEDVVVAARREFAEEVGTVPEGPLLPLGEFRQSSGKLVIAFALAADFDPATLMSNTFEMEWPPRSGRHQQFPEVDRAEWMGLDLARHPLHKGQRPIVDALLARIDPG